MTDAERAVFLEERKHRIGGSSIAGIIGISPWSTPVSVYLETIGMAGEKEETEAMRRGTILEDPVAQVYAAQKGYLCYNQIHTIIEGYRVAHIDRVVDVGDHNVFDADGNITSKKILECKTARNPWEGGVPPYYIVQGDWYMIHCPTVESVDFACKHSVFGYSRDIIETLAAVQKRIAYSQEAREYYLEFITRFGNDNFDIFTVERDDERNLKILSLVDEFWQNHVNRYFQTGDLTGCAPEPVNEEDVKSLWKKHKPNKLVRIDFSDLRTSKKARDVAQAVVSKFDLDEQIAALKEKSDGFKFEIQKELKDAEALVDGSNRAYFTYRSGKEKDEVDWEALARSMKPTEEQIRKFTRTKTGSRSFRSSNDLSLLVPRLREALSDTLGEYEANGALREAAEQEGQSEVQFDGEPEIDDTPFSDAAADTPAEPEPAPPSQEDAKLAEAESIF